MKPMTPTEFASPVNMTDYHDRIRLALEDRDRLAAHLKEVQENRDRLLAACEERIVDGHSSYCMHDLDGRKCICGYPRMIEAIRQSKEQKRWLSGARRTW